VENFSKMMKIFLFLYIHKQKSIIFAASNQSKLMSQQNKTGDKNND